MIRFTLFAAALLIPGQLVSAADWRDSAFPVKKHNFGTVAVAAKTEFTFPIYNTFNQPLHIRSVRASCGCTTPILASNYIEPNGTGTLKARFNTDTFRGKRGATLTVVIDKPFYGEVRLRVDGYIRSDMVFHPGSIEFSKMKQGETVTKSTKLMYAGRSNWQVVDVQSNRPWLVPTVEQLSRGNGRVNYEISVTVREDAPTGFFQDEIVVVTNDRTMPRVPLKVAGEVDSPLSISPQAIALGGLKSGQGVTQKMILLGQKPFKIESIEADGWDISFEGSDEEKSTHVLLPTFTPKPNVKGPIKSTIVITTAGDDSVTAKALLTADIRD